jgi:hypothetical protein
VRGLCKVMFDKIAKIMELFAMGGGDFFSGIK